MTDTRAFVFTCGVWSAPCYAAVLLVCARVHAVVIKKNFSCALVRRYLGGERNIERIAIFDLSTSIQNREWGKTKRDLDLRKIGKLAIQNRKFDLDLQHCCQQSFRVKGIILRNELIYSQVTNG